MHYIDIKVGTTLIHVRHNEVQLASRCRHRSIESRVFLDKKSAVNAVRASASGQIALTCIGKLTWPVRIAGRNNPDIRADPP